MKVMSIKQQVWNALRASEKPLTAKEIWGETNTSLTSIKITLKEWIDLGLIKVALSKPQPSRGRYPNTYLLIDRSVESPPSKLK